MKELLDRLIHSFPGSGRGRGRDDPERLGREVVRLYEEGQYRQAQDVARRLVEVQRERLGERHPEYASAVTNLAVLLQTQGDLAAAEPLLRQAMEVRKEALGETDTQYAASLSQLADLLQLRGDLHGAEPLLRQALEIRREALGVHHPDYAASLTGLALVLHRRGDGEAAEPLLRQALEIRREALGDRHPMVATALGNIGLVLQRRGDGEAAEPLLRQALEIRREALGEHHPDYAASLSHLGTLLFERQDHAAAEPLLRQAVTIRKEALGGGHPDVVADLQTLEAILQSRAQPKLLVAGSHGPGPGPGSHPTREAVPIPALASDSALEQLGRGPREIAGEARALVEAFRKVGAALAMNAQRMEQGFPADMQVLHDAAACHNAFNSIHDEGLRRAEAVDLAFPDETVLSLADLAALLDRVARTEEELPGRLAVQRQALSVLDRLLHLRHVDPTETAMLRPIHEASVSLRARLAEARLTAGLPDDASHLASGKHPLAVLLQLVESSPTLSDDAWSRCHSEVATTFGRPLAAAAARRRLEPTAAPTRVVSLNGTNASASATRPVGVR